MNKIIGIINRISAFVIILVSILLISYFAILYYFRDFIPLPIFLEINRIYINILAVGFFILLPVILVVSKNSQIIQFSLFILVGSFFCWFGYSTLFIPEKILDTIEFNNHRYYVTVRGSVGDDHVIYSMYQCNFENIECKEIYDDISRSIENMDLVIDTKANELQFFIKNQLVFVEGVKPPEILTYIQVEKAIYYIGVFPWYGSSEAYHNEYNLYKCDNSFGYCNQLPFYYTDTGGTFNLLYDEELQQLRVYKMQFNDIRNFNDDTLIYTYDVEPKCHIENCTIPTE